MNQLQIRLARESDLPIINDIYNHYVVNSTCTYQMEPEKMEDRARWFAAHGVKHPVTVVEVDGNVLGWGSLSKFHQRAAYQNTVENSIYIYHEQRRKGLGAAILTDQIRRARETGHHTILAIIDADQVGSIGLHEKFGFARAAHLKQLGFKFGRWLDVVYMQLML
jgi:L-amino acid N-acyltransferase YncA